MHKLIYIVFIFLIIGCTKTVNQNGYLVFEHSEVMYFIPVKELSLETSAGSFYSENLNVGIGLGSVKIYFDSIRANLDTLRGCQINEDKSEQNSVLKILPVNIRYNILEKHNGNQKWTYRINNKIVQFYINTPELKLDTIIFLKLKQKNLIGEFHENLLTCPKKQE